MDWWTVMEKYVFFSYCGVFLALISCCLDKVFDRHFSLGRLSLSEKEVPGRKNAVSLSCVCVRVSWCVCSSASILIQTIAWLFKNKEVPLSKIVIWINWLCWSITWKTPTSVSRGQTQQEEQKDTLHIIYNTTEYKNTLSLYLFKHTKTHTLTQTQEINMTEDYILDHSLLSLFFTCTRVTTLHPFLQANLHSLWDLRRSTSI